MQCIIQIPSKEPMKNQYGRSFILTQYNWSYFYRLIQVQGRVKGNGRKSPFLWMDAFFLSVLTTINIRQGQTVKTIMNYYYNSFWFNVSWFNHGCRFERFIISVAHLSQLQASSLFQSTTIHALQQSNAIYQEILCDNSKM